MSATDVWFFRLLVAALAFAAVFVGCRFVGRYLHEQDANERAHRERGADEALTDARWLAQGYNDTHAYIEMSGKLTDDERAKSFHKPHIVEEKQALIAGGAAVLAIAAVWEYSRIWARKRQAQRDLARRR